MLFGQTENFIIENNDCDIHIVADSMQPMPCSNAEAIPITRDGQDLEIRTRKFDASGDRQGATVTIETTDGRAVTDTVHVPNGAGMLGIDWADIDTKYRALAPHAQLRLAGEEGGGARR